MPSQNNTRSDANSKTIRIHVVEQDLNEQELKIPLDMSFQKLKNVYLNQNMAGKADIRLMFNGERIDDDDTPESKEMEEGDTIEIFEGQRGGGNGRSVIVPKREKTKDLNSVPKEPLASLEEKEDKANDNIQEISNYDSYSANPKDVNRKRYDHSRHNHESVGISISTIIKYLLTTLVF